MLYRITLKAVLDDVVSMLKLAILNMIDIFIGVVSRMVHWIINPFSDLFPFGDS